MKLESKLPSVGTTIFTVMSALATEQGAVNLGQGLPDLPMDPRLVEAVARAMRDGHNQYAPMAGLPALREMICEKIARLYHTAVHPDQVTITPGGTYAIYTALTTILQPGDEVIVFEPAYDSYIPNIEINGGIAVTVELQKPDYRINWAAVKAALSPRTKALLINSPHNPTGTILGESDIQALRELVQERDLFIIADEVYEHLVYDGRTHHSLLRYEDLLSRSFVCFSFGKVYHCTGWKLGYCVAPDAMTKEFRKVHQYNAFSCFTPTQVALASFLKETEVYDSLAGQLQTKRDLFVHLMQKTRFTLFPSSGSYFICGSFEGISTENDQTFARRLVKEAGVATIPLSAFYRNGSSETVLRFCFAKHDASLELAAERLALC